MRKASLALLCCSFLVALSRCASTGDGGGPPMGGTPAEDFHCGDAPSRYCVNDCWTDALESRPFVCGATGWVCPAGFIDERTCSGGSACGYMPVPCCNACNEVVEYRCGSTMFRACVDPLHACAAPGPVVTDSGCAADAGDDGTAHDASAD